MSSNRRAPQRTPRASRAHFVLTPVEHGQGFS
jgi:hypothetical protein